MNFDTNIIIRPTVGFIGFILDLEIINSGKIFCYRKPDKKEEKSDRFGYIDGK